MSVCQSKGGKSSPKSSLHQSDAIKPSSTKSHSFVRSSKFRHIEGQLSHRSSAIDKLPSLSSTVPGDSNAFDGNKERVAVVLSMAGGQVAVLEVCTLFYLT